MILKAYKKNIAEGKGILVFSLLFAIVIRFLYHILLQSYSPAAATAQDGYLWNYIAPLFEDELLSLASSSLFTLSIAITITYINNKFNLIRVRTWLPLALCLLLFSCHPLFNSMSPAYISSIFVLITISIALAAYNGKYKQGAAFRCSFTLTLGSLFSPILLLYIPVFWIVLGILRCFNFKSLLTSIFSIFIIYFPIFSIYVYAENIDLFLAPFLAVNLDTLSNFPILSLTYIEYGILGFSIIMLCIILTDNYINHYKDKIRIRAYLGALTLIIVFAGLLFILFNINSSTNLYIALTASTFLLSHFYALVEKKGTVFLFYFSLIIYILICFSAFLPSS